MNIKNRLSNEKNNMASLSVDITEAKKQEREIIHLTDRIDEFITWYCTHVVNKYYTGMDAYHQPRKMRDFIEKMAIWYEMRYPNYEVNRIIPGLEQEQTKINDVMFKCNPYINDILGSNSDIKDLDWDEFYNVEAFINSLTLEEKELFLSSPEQKEEILNCVMYTIIERGGRIIGPRRALLFAKEFGRNIDIPMIYGVDYSDRGLRTFINEYIKLGGSKELVCYIDYFSKNMKSNYSSTITVQELINTIWKDETRKYTEEETEYHQRLTTILAFQVDKEELNTGKRLSLHKN